MPYSLDLRKRVVAAVKGGLHKTEASRMYAVCRKTIYSWLKLEASKGSLEPIIGFQKGHSHGIKDLEAFRSFVDAHADYTQEEIAAHFSVGSSTVGRALKKIQYTRKKRVKPTQRGAKKSDKAIWSR